MKNIKHLIFIFICMFCSSLVFAKDEITIEKMIPVYDENSGVIVSEENGVHSVIFNDKDQNVKYNIVLKNNTKRDISLKDIVLPESPEEFFKYELVGLDEDTVLEPNSIEEVVLSLETVKTEGWGRNFTLDLTNKVEVLDNVVNPNTSAQELIVLFVSITFITGIVTICLKNKKVSRYVVLVVMFGSLMSVTNAKDPIILPIKLNVSFESQNVMQKAYNGRGYYNNPLFTDFWDYYLNIVNIYIENDFTEITDYYKKYDVSMEDNERVIAYLVNNDEDSSYYDVHIQADGIIYANADASCYFAGMKKLKSINNLQGLDTSLVTNMYEMFAYSNEEFEGEFKLDLNTWDTRNVTNMAKMFSGLGSSSSDLIIDISNFDTRNVTDTSYMFEGTGNINTSIIIKNPATLSYTDMFKAAATKPGAQITVNYTSETEELVDKMIATKSSNSNVVKEIQVD